MTLSEINEVLRERIRATAKAAFDIDLDQVASETPPKTELGDFAFPIAFDRCFTPSDTSESSIIFSMWDKWR